MSSERSGTPTRGHLDREKAREVLDEYVAVERDHGPSTEDDFLDALEACVVPDPRIKAVEAYFDRGRDWADDPDVIEANVRAILRGDE